MWLERVFLVAAHGFFGVSHAFFEGFTDRDGPDWVPLVMLEVRMLVQFNAELGVNVRQKCVLAFSVHMVNFLLTQHNKMTKFVELI